MVNLNIKRNRAFVPLYSQLNMGHKICRDYQVLRITFLVKIRNLNGGLASF